MESMESGNQAEFWTDVDAEAPRTKKIWGVKSSLYTIGLAVFVAAMNILVGWKSPTGWWVFWWLVDTILLITIPLQLSHTRRGNDLMVN